MLKRRDVDVDEKRFDVMLKRFDVDVEVGMEERTFTLCPEKALCFQGFCCFFQTLAELRGGMV
ncbi:MAG: hypothetical protein IJC88_01305 [Oscillospiraceae bacterium]|nr:hypothetical protein [Oscillospiraceae bacterium]